jgi:replication factor A1
MAIKDIEPKKGFELLEAKAISVSDARDVRGGELKVQDVEIKDETGTTTLTLWNDEVGTVKVGDTVKVAKGWANEFQGKISVSAGKFGTLEVVPGTGAAAEVAPEVAQAIEEDII